MFEVQALKPGSVGLSSAFLQKGLRKLSALSGLTVAVSLMLAGAAAAQTKWDLAIAWPPENFHVKNVIRFADKVKEVTNGDVQITVHSGGALGLKGPETLGALSRGIVPIAEYVPVQSVGEVPFMGIGSLPFLMTSYDELRAFDKIVRPHMEKLAAKHNHRILYVAPWQGHGIYSKAPIESVAALKQLKIRTTDKNGSDLFRRLGASPVQVPWSEAITLLASGALNAMTTSSVSGVDTKAWDFTKNFTRVNWMIPTSHVAVNLDAWNQLKPEHREAIASLAKAMEEDFWRVAMEQDKIAQDQLVSNGMSISDAKPELKAEFMKAGTPMWNEFTDRVGEPAATVLNEYRKAVGK